MPNSLWPRESQPTKPLCPWDFPCKDNWSGLPFPSPGDLPHPGMEPGSPALAGGFITTEPAGKPLLRHNYIRLDSSILSANWVLTNVCSCVTTSAIRTQTVFITQESALSPLHHCVRCLRNSFSSPGVVSTGCSLIKRLCLDLSPFLHPQHFLLS